MGKELSYGCYNDDPCDDKGFGINPKFWQGAHNWCMKNGPCKFRKVVK